MTRLPIRFLGVSLAAAIATAASAQQAERVVLRAGEHAGFSRVVLDLADLGAWSAERDGRSLTLRFDGRDIRFDAAQIQPARRVTRVLRAEGARREDASLLTMTLACDCDTNVFALDRNRLVIDVRDRVAEAPASAEGPRTTGEDAIALAPGTAPPPKVRPTSTANNLRELVAAAAPAAQSPDPAPAAWASDPAPSLTPQAGSAPPAPASASAPASAAPAATAATAAHDVAPTPSAAAETVDVEAARHHLLEQLTRAAEQGLLEFRPTPPAVATAGPADPEAAPADATGTVHEDAVETPEAAVAEPMETGDAAPHSEPTGEETGRSAAPPEGPPSVAPASALIEPRQFAIDPQISARSVFDRDAALARNSRAKAPDFCVADRHLDIANWASDAPMADQAPALRAKLLGEFDKVDGEATLALARLHIHFGFGVEAESALRVLENGGASDAVKEIATLLVDLARIVDGRPPTADGPVARSVGCAGRVGMWRLLAGLPETPLDEAAMEELAATAPLHLRRLLAPRLVEALLDRDEVALAGRIHALLARAEGDHGDAFRLAAARLAAAEGRVAAAEGGYRALIADNSILADRALLHLAESLLARGAPAPARLVGDLEAMAFQLRGTPLGRRLRVAEVRLRAGGAGLGPTMSRIERDMATDPAAADDLRRAAQDIWRTAKPLEGDPAEYVRAAILYLRLVGATPDADAARLAAARELVGLGLPDLVLDALAPPLGRGLSAARLAAAEAHLARRDPPAALAALDGEGGEAAELLRARAHAAAGAYPTAFATLAEVDGDEARAIRAAAAWRGGDWTAAAELAADPDRRAMAAFMAHDDRPVVAAAAPTQGDAAPAEDPDAAARAVFAAGGSPSADPSLRAAREALDQAASARRFLEKVMNDG